MPVNLHVESELKFRLSVRVVDLEKAVDELLEVNVSTVVEVEHSEEALTNDTWKLRVLHKQTHSILLNEITCVSLRSDVMETKF